LILSNYHTHGQYCDGLSTIEEHIKKAISLGFHSIGFSGHGYVPFEGVYYGMTPDLTRQYRADVNAMKIKYRDRLNIFLGLENDSAFLHDTAGYDYTIGSVHCIKCNDKYYSVDSKDEIAVSTITNEFGGDGEAYAEAYYNETLALASARRADIFGHFDLVRRFNAGGCRFFNEKGNRYRSTAGKVLERAVHSGYIIEVSTGPIQKGFSNETYPANFLLEIARDLGARVIVNSDAHLAENLNYAFDKAESALREIGFAERWELTPGGFEAVEI
jgi:histidinol-phosphatase (PHP family)